MPRSKTKSKSAAPLTDDELLGHARQTLHAERDAISALAERIDKAFVDAARRIHRCTGSVVITGMGKAYLVGQKISATLASTGTPSLVLHPSDALHGDLGRVRKGDIAIVLTNAGETEELVRLIEPLKAIGATLVAVTGRPDSTIGRACKIVLDIGRLDEACPLGLAPTTSTTTMLALGDALALAILRLRDFSSADFARYHPAGSLGRKLVTVDQVMRTGGRAVTARPDWTVGRLLKAVNRSTYRAGAGLVTDDEGRLVGIFTDGDLRRHLANGSGDLLKRPVEEVMIRQPKRVVSGQSVAEAAELMKEHQIDEVPVVDGQGRLLGLIDIQDLLSRGFA